MHAFVKPTCTFRPATNRPCTANHDTVLAHEYRHDRLTSKVQLSQQNCRTTDSPGLNHVDSPRTLSLRVNFLHHHRRGIAPVSIGIRCRWQEDQEKKQAFCRNRKHPQVITRLSGNSSIVPIAHQQERRTDICLVHQKSCFDSPIDKQGKPQ